MLNFSILGDRGHIRGANMDIKKRGIERGQLNGDIKTSAEELAALFRGVSEASNGEIEKLVSQLQRLRTQLENAGNRIESDIAQYTELSRQTTQLTAIITDSVSKFLTVRDRKSCTSSGSLAIIAAIRRASSLLSNLAAERRPGSLS